MAGEKEPYQLGDAGRQASAEAIAFLDALKAAQPASITNAERKADKEEIAKLKADLELIKRVVVNHVKEIRDLKGDLAAVRNAVVELQRQRQPQSRGAVHMSSRKSDGLDQALERELYD